MFFCPCWLSGGPRWGRGDEVLIRESSHAHFPRMESRGCSPHLRSRPAALSPWGARGEATVWEQKSGEK